MKSPFPGMDPYLERYWGDVHSSLIIFAKVAIQKQLGGGLIASSEYRVYIELEDSIRRQARVPDVRIISHGISDIPIRPSGDLIIAEPVVMEIDWEPISESYIQIIDASDGDKVITAIEFVSPSNKLFKAARESYFKKQEEFLDSKASLVEVDLTRAGRRKLLIHENELPSEKRGEYLVGVYRGYVGRYGRREGYGIKLRETLPRIRIPLRTTDPDIVLDLQSMVDQAYEAGAHDLPIDYKKECDPPLAEADTDWADALLREAGRRK